MSNPSTGLYTYIHCPCRDQVPGRPGNGAFGSGDADDSDDDMAFDPRGARANYSLFPLEHLMYCNECHQIRCPRCISEEIMTYYCPSCIFEVPSSNIKSEGNRCTRSCFQCPVCIGTLIVTPLDRAPPTDSEAAVPASGGGPYALNCTYCLWSSTEIGIEFDKSNGVYGQLARIKNGGQPKLTPRELKERRKDASAESILPDSEVDPDMQFANLKALYQSQSSETTSSGTTFATGDLGLNSPGSISRIMSIYTSGSMGAKRSAHKPLPPAEATNTSEGLKLAQLDESALIKKLHNSSYTDYVSQAQNAHQTYPARFSSDLRPIPTLLRTKRAKRCLTCRQYVIKPEAKVLNHRFRVNLTALKAVPSIAIRLLSPGPPVPSRNIPVTPALPMLKPLSPTQFVLTFENPVYEPVTVTLATSSSTQGRFSSTVTLLCPQFTIGSNNDVFYEALNSDKRRTRGPDELLVAEAGKILDKGNNWVSVVMEVVPPELNFDRLRARNQVAREALARGEDPGLMVDEGPLKEDEDIVEIPLFVRVDWETTNEEGGHKEKHELAYWAVLGVGKIMME